MAKRMRGLTHVHRSINRADPTPKRCASDVGVSEVIRRYRDHALTLFCDKCEKASESLACLCVNGANAFPRFDGIKRRPGVPQASLSTLLPSIGAAVKAGCWLAACWSCSDKRLSHGKRGGLGGCSSASIRAAGVGVDSGAGFAAAVDPRAARLTVVCGDTDRTADVGSMLPMLILHSSLSDSDG
jgi:hypothetical protein